MARVRVFNGSDRQVFRLVLGQAVVVPAHGQADVTPAEREVLLAEFPKQISTGDPTAFSEAQIAAVGRLTPNTVLALLRKFMRGERVEIPEAEAPANLAPQLPPRGGGKAGEVPRQ